MSVRRAFVTLPERLPLKALIKNVYENRRLMENLLWTIERTMQYEMAGDDSQQTRGLR